MNRFIMTLAAVVMGLAMVGTADAKSKKGGGSSKMGKGSYSKLPSKAGKKLGKGSYSKLKTGKKIGKTKYFKKAPFYSKKFRSFNKRYWNPKYRCYFRFCPRAACWYYWCQSRGCFCPISYIETAPPEEDTDPIDDQGPSRGSRDEDDEDE